jgi:hypothetical protein
MMKPRWVLKREMAKRVWDNKVPFVAPTDAGKRDGKRRHASLFGTRLHRFAE